MRLFHPAPAQNSAGTPALAHRSHRLHDNFDDRIPALMRDAGLANPSETAHRVTRIGRYTCYRADR